MRGCWIGALALGIMPSLAGCNGPGPFEIIDPEDVRITLTVSGGFVGMSFTFVVEGGTLEVRGGPCRSWCDWEEGELLLPISRAQVTDLSERLERADVFDRAGDYGTECCDQIDYDLVYRNDGREAHVRGTSSRIPSDLAQAIGHLSTLASRRLPVLVAPESVEADWPRDPLSLDEFIVDGSTLTTELTWGGGCALHRIDLVTWGGWLETNPVSINAILTHDDGDDLCDALVAEQRTFDLLPLAIAHREAYGPTDGPVRITLRLRDPGTGEIRLIELEL